MGSIIGSKETRRYATKDLSVSKFTKYFLV